MRSVIVTLFEGDYVLGVGALVNSLYAHGFRGVVYAGYRGELTGWASSAVSRGQCVEISPADRLVIRFVPLAPGWHMTNLKPHFMLNVWDEWESQADALFYFDPDIIVTCRWSFYEEWAGCGVAMCQELVMGAMPDDHPLRVKWKRWSVSKGWTLARTMDTSFNGGFVGVRKTQREALELWRDVINEIGQEFSLDRLSRGDRSDPFFLTDQDALNVVSMVYPGDLSRIGPEGMNFVSGGFTMTHAAGGAKPWRKQYVPSALGGVAPSPTDKAWAKNLESPIEVFSARKVSRVRKSVKIASAIGRFIRRS